MVIDESGQNISVVANVVYPKNGIDSKNSFKEEQNS